MDVLFGCLKCARVNWSRLEFLIDNMRNSMAVVVKKTSATWWSVKPRIERHKNSPGRMAISPAETTPAQRLNRVLPIK